MWKGTRLLLLATCVVSTKLGDHGDHHVDEHHAVEHQEAREAKSIQDNAVKDVNSRYNFQYKVADEEEQVYQQHTQNMQDQVVTGEYSWVDPEGTLQIVRYRADDTGYHIVDTVTKRNFVTIVPKVRTPKKILRRVRIQRPKLATGSQLRRIKLNRTPVPVPAPAVRVVPAPTPVRVFRPAPTPVTVFRPAPAPVKIVRVAPVPTPVVRLTPAPTPAPLRVAPAPLPVRLAPAPAPILRLAPIVRVAPTPLRRLQNPVPASPLPLLTVPGPRVTAEPKAQLPSSAPPAQAQTTEDQSEKTRRLFGNSEITVVKFNSPTHKYEYY